MDFYSLLSSVFHFYISFTVVFFYFLNNFIKQTHLVEDSTLTDELFPGLGVDRNSETDVWYEKLREEILSESVNQAINKSISVPA